MERRSFFKILAISALGAIGLRKIELQPTVFVPNRDVSIVGVAIDRTSFHDCYAINCTDGSGPGFRERNKNTISEAE